MNQSDELSICTELNGFLQLVDTHLLEAMADLRQINLILDEAIIALNTSFFSIHDSLERHGNSLGDKDINQMVTALQFHDLTTQLSSRLLKRLSGMSEIVNSAQSLQHNNTNIFIHLLIDINKQVLDLNSELHNKFNQSLNQQHMSSGDLELF